MKRRYLQLGFVIALIFIFLVSCGGSSTEGGGEGGSAVGSIALSAEPAEDIPADGSSSAAITATLKDSSGKAVANGTMVTFSTNLGVFASNPVPTGNDSGTAVASLSSTTPGPATVTASSGGATQGVTVVFVAAPDVPASLSLESSKTTVKSDNSDSATITAVARSQSSAVIEGVTVSFNATDGELSASHAVTDADGKASVTFKSGADKENHYVSISASVFGVEEPRYVNVEITKTTVALSADTTNIEVGAAPVDLTVTVSDAAWALIGNAPVILTASPAGRVSLSEYSGNTDPDTKLLAVEVSGTASGSVTVTAQSLGAEASQDFVVGETVFGITSPEEDTVSLYTGSNLPIVVNAPDQANVLFVTTVGTLTGAGGTGRVITEPVLEGTASAVLSSDVAGIATVRVMDSTDPSTSDSLKVDFYSPVSESSQIVLQANPTVIETNAGDINTATLVATVRNADDQVIRNVPVAFSMKRSTGSGEFISPSIAYTNNEGKATATFTSGSLSSGANGVEICAEVAVGGIPAIAPSCVSIIIGDTAGAITITQGSVIESVSNDTAYRLPMSVQVTDSDGSPVKGTAVSLGVWPTRCASGHWVEVKENEPWYECVLINEDENRNLIMDPGEDRNGDGFLTPPISAAGAIPRYVTTDENGVATFDLIYLKSSAAWIEDEVTATTYVLGTETKSTYTFWLPWLEDESCHLPHSPYNTKSVALCAVPSTLAADGSTSTVTAVVTDALNRPTDGDTVNFSVTSGTGTVDPAWAVTVNGIAETTYTASNTPGTETVTAAVEESDCASATVDITLNSAALPEAKFDAEPLGDDEHVLFTDASLPSAATGAPIISWYWTFDQADGITQAAPDSYLKDPGSIYLTGSSTGNYVVTLRVTDALGAQDTVMEVVDVAVPPAP